MSTVHYWADLHLGHELVAKLRGFTNAAEHDQAIITAWREAVHPRDTIWILGDLAASSPTRALGSNEPVRMTAIFRQETQEIR